jgi:hypothetical protein
LEAGFSVGHDHFHDIEAEGDFGAVEHAQPGAGAAADEGFFFGGDGVGGALPFVTRPRLHLDEGEDVLVAVAADEIDFTSVPGAEVPVEDLVAIATEELRGEFLTLAAEPMAGVLRLGCRI